MSEGIPTREEAVLFWKQYLAGADAKAQALHDQLVAQGLNVTFRRYPSKLDGTFRFEVTF